MKAYTNGHAMGQFQRPDQYKMKILVFGIQYDF